VITAKNKYNLKNKDYMNPIPELSVVMPVYNAEKFLKDSIESILNQSFTNFEFIILNDKSTDESLEIIKKYQKLDSRIIIFDKVKNVGPANIRNEGFAIAKGAFIALMDADDVAINTRFEKQITLLKNNPEIGVCGTWFTFFGAKKNKIARHSEHHDAIKISFLQSCGIGNPTVMVRKKIVLENQFNNEYVLFEDYDLWSRLLFKTKFYNIQESLLHYRQHDTNTSNTKKELANSTIRKIKINQMSQFGVVVSDPNIDSYLNAISLKRGLLPIEIKAVLKASKYLLIQNKKLQNFNNQLLEKTIERNLIRTIRNAKEYNFSFYFELKNEEKNIFSKMSIIDKIIIILKSSLSRANNILQDKYVSTKFQ
jgi:glycosyltransferase involved in cell wall biosynthesis